MTRRNNAERILRSKSVYDGKQIKLVENEVVLPSGKETTREVIEHPGSVAIVPMLDENTIVMVKQYRLPAHRALWEIPAGTRKRGESPKKCARRELEEETGYRAQALTLLFRGFLTPGYSTELMHFFVARTLQKHSQSTEEDEQIRVTAIEREALIEMIRDGRIIDTKTVAAIAYLSLLEEKAGG